jgi:hypothetical protein
MYGIVKESTLPEAAPQEPQQNVPFGSFVQ